MEGESKMKDIEIRIKELEDELKELREEEKMRKEQREPKPWKPKCMERYYFIKNGFYVGCCRSQNNRTDKRNFEIGNCFPTRERAEQVADKIKFLLRLEFLHDKYCPGFLNKQDYKNSIFRASEGQEYQVFKSVGVYFGDEEVIKKVEEELKNNPQL